MNTPPLKPAKRTELPITWTEVRADILAACRGDRHPVYLLGQRRPRTGATLRPGRGTPLWNAVVREVRPYLRPHGAQAKLGRLLGLDRQTVHAYFIARTRMPDAERTLKLLTLMIAVRNGLPRS